MFSYLSVNKVFILFFSPFFSVDPSHAVNFLFSLIPVVISWIHEFGGHNNNNNNNNNNNKLTLWLM